MHMTIMKIKNHKKYQIISLSNFLKILFFRKYNYTSKIFPKIFFKFYSNVIKTIWFKGSILVLSPNKWIVIGITLQHLVFLLITIHIPI